MTEVRRLDEHTMESRDVRHDPLSRGERQPAVKPTAVVAAGLAASVAAFFTSHFGITGAILGEVLNEAVSKGEFRDILSQLSPQFSSLIDARPRVAAALINRRKETPSWSTRSSLGG
jgi:hypothetical protein